MAVLKILIGVMTALIVVGVVAVVWRIATFSGDGAAAFVPQISLGLASDCTIASLSVGDGTRDDARLAIVTVTGPGDCNAIYVIDLASGAVMTTVRP